MIGGFSNAGGIETHIKNLSDEFIRKNLNVHILSIANENRTFDEEGIKVHLIKGSSFFGYPYVDSLSLLIKEILAIDPDVIHVHGTYLPYSKMVTSLKKINKYPIILTVHGSILQESRLTSKSKAIYYYRFLKLIPELYFENKVVKEADKVIVVSDPLKKIVGSVLNGNSNIIVIPNGVNFDHFQTNSLTNCLIHPSILFLGRLVTVKGCDLLIKAIPLIKKKIPDIHIYIAGDGNQLSALEGMVSELNISDNVSFLGHISGEKKISVLKSADVCVFPSRYESFSIVALEAMACGKPVVASNVGGVPYLVTDGQTGYLFDSENIQQLAEKTIILLRDEALRSKMGLAGKKRVKKMYTWTNIAESVLDLYVECLNDYNKENC